MIATRDLRPVCRVTDARWRRDWRAVSRSGGYWITFARKLIRPGRGIRGRIAHIVRGDPRFVRGATDRADRGDNLRRHSLKAVGHHMGGNGPTCQLNSMLSIRPHSPHAPASATRRRVPPAAPASRRRAPARPPPASGSHSCRCCRAAAPPSAVRHNLKCCQPS